MSILEQIPQVVTLPPEELRLETVWQATENGLEDTGQLRVSEVPDSVPLSVYQQNISASAELLAQSRMRNGFAHPSAALRARIEQQYGTESERVLGGAQRNADALRRVARELFMVASGVSRGFDASTTLTAGERAYRREAHTAFELFAKQRPTRHRVPRRGRAA